MYPFLIFGRCTAALLGSLLLVAVPPLLAQADSRLSIEQAVGIAEGNAPALNAAMDGARASRELAVIAGQLPDPVLRLGVDNLPVNGPDRGSLTRDFMTMRRIGVMQEYVSADRRALLRHRAEIDATRMDATRRSLATNLRRDVATAWLERYFAIRARELLKTLEAEIGIQLRTLDSQVRAGKAVAADSPMASALLLQTQDRMLVVDRQERLAQIALARWVGKDADRDLATPPNIEILAVNPADPALMDMIPSVRAHASEAELAQSDLAIAESGKRPNWSWELSYSQRGSAYSNMVSFGVNIPLTFNAVNRQDREVVAKQAQLAQAQASHEDLLRETRTGFAVAYAEWQNLIERRRRLSESLSPVVRQRIDLTLAAYRAGQGSLASVLEARRGEVESQLQLIDLQREAARLWAQLHYVYGQGARP